MMRKLLIVSILPLLTATGCETLQRVEVWKQQTFFSPPAAQTVVTGDPCAPAQATCASPCPPQAATPYYSQSTTAQKPVDSTTEYSSGETVISDEAVPAQSAPALGPAGSPEVINGVLEQP
jgi:hypothetical protein